MDLARQLYKAKVLHVDSLNSLSIDIDTGIDGVHIKRTVVLEGVFARDIPVPKQRDAMHCLVVLVGGKNIAVRLGEKYRADGAVIARVFLPQKVHGSPPGIVTQEELPEPVLEVSTFYLSLLDNGFDTQRVKAVLNGSPE